MPGPVKKNEVGPRNRKRVTFSDIAREAGVSKTTVSLVLSGSKEQRISEATCERVRAIANQLGFIPSQLGKGFLQGKSRIIGVVMSYTQYALWLEAYAVVQEELAKAGYVAIAIVPSWKLVQKDGDKGKGSLDSSEYADFRRLLEYQIDGLLYHSLNPEDALDILEDVARYQLPTVMMGTSPFAPPVDRVRCDEAKIGRMVARHLLSLKLKTYGVAEYEYDFPMAAERRDAFVDELKKAGKPCTTFPVSDLESVVRHLPALLPTPAGIFALNDIFAAMVIQAAQKLAWRVPGDLSVVGMGNLAFTQYGALPLASVKRHSDQIVGQATKFLIECIQGYTGPPREVVISPELIVRESAMPASPTGNKPRPARRNAGKT